MSEAIAAPIQQAPTQTAPPAGAEPVVISGGESPASWDELEALTAKPRTPKEPKAEKKSEPKEDKSEETDKKGTESKKETKGVEKIEAPAKLLKLRSGDKELEIGADTLIPVKIDGKTVDIPIQEAINRYSQQSHLDKLYKSYKTDKEGFEKERKQMSEALNKSYDFLVEKKDLRGFIDYLGEAMGVDSQSLYQDAVGGISKQIEEYQGLSPEQRKLKELESENSYHRSRMEEAKKTKELAKSRAELESNVQTVMTSHGMDKSALVKSWDELISLGHKAEEITPEFLGSYYSNTQKIGMIETKLKEINPELAANQEIIEQLATHAIQTELTSEEIAEVITQLYGETPESKLAKKIEKNQKSSAQKGLRSQKNPGSDPLFFDDI